MSVIGDIAAKQARTEVDWIDGVILKELSSPRDKAILKYAPAWYSRRRFGIVIERENMSLRTGEFTRTIRIKRHGKLIATGKFTFEYGV